MVGRGGTPRELHLLEVSTSLALTGAIYLIALGAFAVFTFRVVRVISGRGNADRRTLVRLAVLRACGAILGTVGVVIAAFCNAAAADLLFNLRVPRMSPGIIVSFIFICLGAWSAAWFGVMAIASGLETREAWRSFAMLRWFGARGRVLRLRARRTALFRKYDRRLW